MLFQPQPGTKPLFDALIAALNVKNGTTAPAKPLLLERVVTWALERQQRKEAAKELAVSRELPPRCGPAQVCSDPPQRPTAAL